jgi:hypothetical protein
MPIPGMIYPTQRAMLASNPRDSAIAQQNAADQKLSNMINKLSGGKRNKNKRQRRGGSISVPQFQMNYTPQSGPGQDPNSIIKQNALIGTQNAANSVYDSYATKLGGTRKRYRRKSRGRGRGKSRSRKIRNRTTKNKGKNLRGGNCGTDVCPI